MEENLKKAYVLADVYHKGQVDKSGKPYMAHLSYVSDHCIGKAKIVALLHDILEDTSCTVEELSATGFDEEIIEAVKAVTKGNESYEQYLECVKGNELAREVKLEDLKHNMDLTRLTEVGEEELKRVEKYRAALKYLCD